MPEEEGRERERERKNRVSEGRGGGGGGGMSGRKVGVKGGRFAALMGLIILPLIS